MRDFRAFMEERLAGGKLDELTDIENVSLRYRLSEQEVDELKVFLMEYTENLLKVVGDAVADYQNEFLKFLSDGIQKWVVTEYSPEVEKWLRTQFVENPTGSNEPDTISDNPVKSLKKHLEEALGIEGEEV